MREAGALQQLSVARQHDPLLRARQLLDLLVADPVVVQGVEAEQPQQAGEPAQVHIGDEAGRAQRPIAHAQQRRDVERLEFRIHGHPVAVAQRANEADRLAVHEHQFDLRVRHAERFDRVLYGGPRRATARELAATPLGG